MATELTLVISAHHHNSPASEDYLQFTDQSCPKPHAQEVTPAGIQNAADAHSGSMLPHISPRIKFYLESLQSVFPPFFLP